MTPNTDDNTHPKKKSYAINSSADIEFEHGVPFTESIQAFQYDSTWLNAVSRSLRDGMNVIIDNDRTPFEVIHTKWIPTKEPDSDASDISIPYSTRSHKKSVHAGPEEDCEFIAILKKEGMEDVLYSLRVAWNDAARPLIARYEGEDLPQDATLEMEGTYSPSEDRDVSRIHRVPPKQIIADEDSRASNLLDEEFAIQQSGPTSTTPLSSFDLSGPEDNSPGDIPSLPDELHAIGRCPNCTSAVVRDINKDRVVCVDCRRWCTNREWASFHSTSS